MSQDLLPTASTPSLSALSVLEQCALQDPLLGGVFAGSVLAACKKGVDMHSHVPCKVLGLVPLGSSLLSTVCRRDRDLLRYASTAYAFVTQCGNKKRLEPLHEGGHR